jgi:hypothetical protein
VKKKPTIIKVHGLSDMVDNYKAVGQDSNLVVRSSKINPSGVVSEGFFTFVSICMLWLLFLNKEFIRNISDD